MKIYHIGVIGHQPHKIKDPDRIRHLCQQTVLALADQYAPNRICLNLTGAPGTSQWIAEACIEYGVDFQLFFPCDYKAYAADWYPDQLAMLERQLGEASGLTQVGQHLTDETISLASRMLVDQSDFIVAFWEGSKHGLTFNAISYAVEQSKIVLDGVSELKMISKKSLAMTENCE